jgi:hypothetical protein
VQQFAERQVVGLHPEQGRGSCGVGAVRGQGGAERCGLDGAVGQVPEDADRGERPDQPAQQVRSCPAGGLEVGDGLRAVVELRGDVELRDYVERLGELEPADELDHLHRRGKLAGGLIRSIAGASGIGHVISPWYAIDHRVAAGRAAGQVRVSLVDPVEP